METLYQSIFFSWHESNNMKNDLWFIKTFPLMPYQIRVIPTHMKCGIETKSSHRKQYRQETDKETNHTRKRSSFNRLIILQTLNLVYRITVQNLGTYKNLFDQIDRRRRIPQTNILSSLWL